MSDEQMFKMDKLLAAVLRTQKDAKNAAKTTKQVSHDGDALSRSKSHACLPHPHKPKVRSRWVGHGKTLNLSQTLKPSLKDVLWR